jgi:hypothetical protein
MSDSNDRLPQNAFLRFRDNNVEPKLRLAAERAVATLVSHSTAATTQRRAAESELAKLTDAIDAPLAKLIHNDPKSVQALQVLRKSRPVGAEEISKLTHKAARFWPDQRVSTRSLPPDVSIITTAHPPFRFSWNWWEGNLAFDESSNHEGYVGIDARSGFLTGAPPGLCLCTPGSACLLRHPARSRQHMDGRLLNTHDTPIACAPLALEVMPPRRAR